MIKFNTKFSQENPKWVFYTATWYYNLVLKFQSLLAWKIGLNAFELPWQIKKG